VNILFYKRRCGFKVLMMMRWRRPGGANNSMVVVR
jgi:DNA-directed RNA polymerase subunit RPC12/RpoP